MKAIVKPLPQNRRASRAIKLGGVQVGGGAAISIQSMCSTATQDAEATLAQIHSLAEAGCEIVRVAVPDLLAIEALEPLCAQSPLPVVADIHFDYRLALKAIPTGIAGLRYNPGNIGSRRRVETLAQAANDRGLAIRIGVNAASLEAPMLKRYGGATPEALVQSALSHAQILEEVGFSQIKLSLKASNVPTTVAAYRLCAERCDYPLHLGLTEAGTLIPGAVKSSLALGILLAEGIGDTIRVSLAADPTLEVYVAQQILQGLNIATHGVDLICCPRCGRSSLDIYKMAERLERCLHADPRFRSAKKTLRVAVMGCEVNGPGEARGADVGICGSKEGWILFAKGKKLRRLHSDDEAEKSLVTELLKVVSKLGKGG